MNSRAGNGLEYYTEFTREVLAEIDSEEQLLHRLEQAPTRIWGLSLATILSVLMVALVLMDNELVYLWFIVGLLLYSYSFVILLIPTTTERIRPESSARTFRCFASRSG